MNNIQYLYYPNYPLKINHLRIRIKSIIYQTQFQSSLNLLVTQKTNMMQIQIPEKRFLILIEKREQQSQQS
ncbi:hypothetical protein pb186bvf_005339 [Paramecium bursaria]